MLLNSLLRVARKHIYYLLYYTYVPYTLVKNGEMGKPEDLYDYFSGKDAELVRNKDGCQNSMYGADFISRKINK